MATDQEMAQMIQELVAKEVAPLVDGLQALQTQVMMMQDMGVGQTPPNSDGSSDSVNHYLHQSAECQACAEQNAALKQDSADHAKGELLALLDKALVASGGVELRDSVTQAIERGIQLLQRDAEQIAIEA